MQNLNKTIINATKWSVVAEIAAKLISPIINMILARLLLPEAFGAVATITMVISFAEIFSDAGFQKYVVQHEFTDERDFDESVNVAFWSNFAISVVIVVIICIFQHPLAELVGSPELNTGMVAASLSIIFVAFSSVQAAVYRRKFNFKALFYIRIIISLIPLIITIPLAIVFRNYWALVIGGLSKDLVNAIILTIKSDWKPRFFYSFRRLCEMLSFSLWTFFETVTIWLTSNIGVFIVGKGLSDYYLGLYKTSMTTVNSYMAIVVSSVTPVLFSALSRCQKDEEKFKETFHGFQKSVAIFLLPMGIGIFIFRDFVVTLLLGNNWMEASGFIGLWGLMNAISIILGSLYSDIYRSKGQPRVSLLLQLAYLFILTPALSLSIQYDFETIYMVRSLIIIPYIITTMLVARCAFGISIITTLKNIFPQTVSALVMGLVGLTLKNKYIGLAWQIVCIGVCMIVYFSVIMLFPSMRKMIFELDFLKKIMGKFRRNHDARI